MNVAMEIALKILDILELNFPWVLATLIILAFRAPLSGLIGRVTEMVFKQGDNELSVTAHTAIEKSDDSLEASKQEPPEKQNVPDFNSEVIDDAAVSWTNIYQLLEAHNTSEADTTFETLVNTISDEEREPRLRSHYYYLRFSQSQDKRGSLEKLKTVYALASSEKNRRFAAEWLSIAYEDSKLYEENCDLWSDFLSRENLSKDSSVLATARLANALALAGQLDEATHKLELAIRSADENSSLSILYDAMSNIEEQRGNQLLALFCKDKAIELRPNDATGVFSTAYASGEIKMAALSVASYVELLRLEPTSMDGTNNLGVKAQESVLNIVSIDYYEASAEIGNTLAMSNLGWAYLNAGFASKADEIADKALGNEKPHDNVYALKTAIAKHKDEQYQSWNQIQGNSQAIQAHIRAYTEQFYRGDRDDLNGLWTTTANLENPVLIQGSTKQLDLEWEQIASALGGGTQFHKIQGACVGSTISGTYTIKAQERAVTTLLSADRSVCFYAYLSDSKQELTLFSTVLSEPIYLSLSRVAAD